MNEPRPPIPVVVGVSIAENAIEVGPRAVGIPGERQANVNQNWNAPQNQAESGVPLVIQFNLSNTTSVPGKLFLDGAVERVERLTANGSGSFLAGLPTGIYRLSSNLSRGTGRLVVGPSRVSSSGDLLTP